MITALGPVHLERMGSLEKIAEAKAEILEKARAAIVNVDYPLLEQLAQKAEEEGKTVWRCSSNGPLADVTVTSEGAGLRVRVKHFSAEMDLVIAAAPTVDPGNVACAVAAALSLGVPAEIVASRLESLPGAPHRRTPQRASNGASVIDDTYNANPAGAKAALGLLATDRSPGREKSGGYARHGRARAGPSQRKRKFCSERRGDGHPTACGGPHQRPGASWRREGRRLAGPLRPQPAGRGGVGFRQPRPGRRRAL